VEPAAGVQRLPLAEKNSIAVFCDWVGVFSGVLAYTMVIFGGAYLRLMKYQSFP